MLRLISSATQTRRRGGKDMSFLRRLFIQGRLLIYRKYPAVFGRGGASKAPDTSILLRIEGAPPRAPPGHGGVGWGSTTTLQKIGTEIHSQVRKLFINNVLRRATPNQEVARKAARRLLYGDSRPFFALVGVSLATGSAGIVTKDSEFDGICWEIRESIAKKSKKIVSEDPTERNIASVEDLTFGPILNKGCSAAVYAAKWNDSSDDNDSMDWPLAVKMLFNYDIESNAFAILKAMVKEIVPARRIDLKNLCDLEHGLFNNIKRCPPHENIIEVKHAFVDHVPLLPEGIERYPSALPKRLNPNDGLGRNMSLFLVMKRYDTSLQEYLNAHPNMRFRPRLLILSQILNGVAHLERAEIAHRDLKTDNILVDLSRGEEHPEIVISDFGCCLADKTLGLSLPFRTYDTDRGGNAALTAPEISTAVPGTWKNLNYKKSDAWTVGAIAYEIFGSVNPFYGSDSVDRLDSRTYSDSDLPLMNGASATIQTVIQQLLRRNPDQRMSAEEAYYTCMLALWAPSQWLVEGVPNEDEILQWLVCLTTKALCHGSDELEYKMIRSFLRRVKFSNLRSAVHRIIQSRV